MIRQRKFFTSTEFDFQPSSLIYTFRNFRGSKQLTVDYAEIPLVPKRIEEHYPSFLFFGIVVFGVGLLLGGFTYSTEESFSGFIFSLWGILFLACYFLQRNVFTVFHVGHDTLLVIGGKNEVEILSQISECRKARFLELLQRQDFVVDDVKRQGLISWLLEHRVISEHEVPNFNHNGKHQKHSTSLH